MVLEMVRFLFIFWFLYDFEYIAVGSCEFLLEILFGVVI